MGSDNEQNSEQVQPEQGPWPGQMCISTTMAVNHMKAGKPGDSVSRSQMAEIIGRRCECDTNGYGNVNSAINHVESQHGIVWRWSKSEQAWICLGDAAKVGVVGDGLKRARKVAKRSLRVGATVDQTNLDDTQRRDHGLNMASAAMVTMSSSTAFRKRLGEVSKPQEPDMQKLIELMKSSQ